MANILDESNAVAQAVIEYADGNNLSIPKRLQLFIGHTLCQFLGIHRAVSIYIATRVGLGLDEEVNRLIEASDLSNRYYSLQLSVEEDTLKVFKMDELMRRSYKSIRAEQSNYQILIATQREEIAKLQGTLRTHEHEMGQLTAILEDLRRQQEMTDSLSSKTLMRLASVEIRTNAIPKD